MCGPVAVADQNDHYYNNTYEESLHLQHLHGGFAGPVVRPPTDTAFGSIGLGKSNTKFVFTSHISTSVYKTCSKDLSPMQLHVVRIQYCLEWIVKGISKETI